ncbi:MAG TPA: tetratricopeptide repeat protein [Sedimentisphaerales bacterium]|nr:tetratricopeptide repeat protein [Sedimentisphaerales bacterium]
MKAEHRHELKTNELARWIADMPDWAKKNFKIIGVAALVVVLAAGSYLYFRYQRSIVSAREQLRLTELAARRLSQHKRDILSAQNRVGDLAYLLLQLAENLQDFARSAEDGDRAALALIKRGETLRAELHYRPRTVSRQDIAAQIERARQSYREALEKSSSNPLLKGMANFGLGLCQEELGNFDEAKQIYQAIVENAEFEGTTVVVQAKQRLETMGDYRKDVVFGAAARPVRPPTTMPRVPLRLPDINEVEITAPEVNRGPVVTDTNVAESPVPESGDVDTNTAGVGLAEANAAGQ